MFKLFLEHIYLYMYCIHVLCVTHDRNMMSQHFKTKLKVTLINKKYVWNVQQ